MIFKSRFFYSLKSFGVLLSGIVVSGTLLTLGALAKPKPHLQIPQVKGAEISNQTTETPEKLTQLTHDLFLGETGPEVELLQEKLGLLVTGIFDKTTRTKVIEEQLRRGIILSSDDYGAGYVGPRTRLWLNKGVVIRAPEPSAESPQSLPVIQPEPMPSPAPSSKPPGTPSDSEPSPSSPSPEPTPAPTPPPEKPEIATASVNVQDLGNFEVKLQENDTALSILLRAGQENGFEVKTKTYVGFGEFVEAIGGKAGDANHYWAFYYNGAYSMVGAGDQPVEEGNVTTWKYESF